MIDVVFISDLHLNPDEPWISERFSQFISWASVSVKTVYILGDFFHAWAGDDSLDTWSSGIATQLRSLTDKGISVYFMAGNRDFLLGKEFAELTGWKILYEPTTIQLDNKKILLVHGDRYCTKDASHQRFRKITRNRLFSFVFLSLPLRFRLNLVDKIRKKSSAIKTLSTEQMDVVTTDMLKHLTKYKAEIVVHGHTHKPGEFPLKSDSGDYTRFVLSDWDDTPKLLCYHYTEGFHFVRLDTVFSEE